MAAPDVAMQQFGLPWPRQNHFDSRQALANFNGNGPTWTMPNLPFAEMYAGCYVAIYGVPCAPIWFELNNGQYQPVYDGPWSLRADGGSLIYDDGGGDAYEFHADKLTLQRYLPAGGQAVLEVSQVADNGFQPRQLRREFTENGVTTVNVLQLEYDDHARFDPHLEAVTYRRQVDGGSWQDLSRTLYSYYQDGDSHGNAGDLRTATSQIWDGSQWQSAGVTMYRWYTDQSSGSSSSSGAGGTIAGEGAAGLLKFLVTPEAYDRLATDPAVSDPLAASDFLVSQYACGYFEYDTAGRVTRFDSDGGARSTTFSHTQSSFPNDLNAWRYRSVETDSDGLQTIRYSNFAGLPMLSVVQSGSDQWRSFTRYDANGRVILQAGPAAVTGFDESKADLLNDQPGNSYQYLANDTGLVRTFEYHTASGNVSVEKIQQGEHGTPLKLREYEYSAFQASSVGSSSSSSSANDPAIWLLTEETVYPSDTNPTQTQVTTYDYTLHDGTLAIRERTTTLTAVPAAEQGANTTATRRDVFDLYGQLTWQMDEHGVLTRTSYDPVTGAVIQIIRDVDTAQVSDKPSGWQTPTGGGSHQVTDFAHDDLGRTTQTLGPAHSIDLAGTTTTVRSASWTIHDDVNHEVRSAQGYATGTSFDTFTLVNPVSITKTDKSGRPLEEIQAIRSSTNGPLLPSDTFTQSSYVRWTTHQRSDCCLDTSTRVYHTIPASGDGSVGTHYDETTFAYDASGRQNRQTSPGGTITRTVFDALGRSQAIYVGTDDTGATVSDPTGNGATGNNMVLVTSYEYDHGSVGDGHLTQQTQHVD